MNIKKLNILRSKQFTKWYFPIYLISWLGWGFLRVIEDPDPKIDQVYWGEQVSIIVLLLMTTAILIMIIIKFHGWKDDIENPSVQIQIAMQNF